MNMKKLEKYEEKCIECHACEDVCAKTYFKSEDRGKSRILINEELDEKGQKINVCNQCGECMEACPELALTRDKNGVVRLDKNKCVECLICVGFCPYLSMRVHKDLLEPFKCIACGLCAKECPTEAIEIVETV